MSIFDNFKSVFNNKNKQISSEPIDVSSSEFYNPTFNIPKSIYEEPTPNSIAHNITAKQTFALSFLLDTCSIIDGMVDKNKDTNETNIYNITFLVLKQVKL